mgnify:FL=1
MTNKHQEFMKSLRSMMLAYEADKAMDEKSSYRDTESANAADDEDISLDEYLATRFDAIFGPIEDD